MQDSKLVSIIIVNWNRWDHVERTLGHLLSVLGDDIEIVVVDNGSTDGSAQNLAALDFIRHVALESNVGPARARNIGVEQSNGKYVLFLDSDAMISRVALKRLIARMESDPTIGVAGCRILNPWTRELDQWLYQYPSRTHEHCAFDTYSFSAAGAIVRRQALRDAGLFWEELFIYNEEVDLSIRVLRAGYRVIYEPAARVFHSASRAGRQSASSYWRFQVRNWIWICYRYYGTFDCYVGVLKYMTLYFFKGLASGHVKDCLMGIRAGLSEHWIRARFPDKLNREEKRRISALGRRFSYWLARG